MIEELTAAGFMLCQAFAVPCTVDAVKDAWFENGDNGKHWLRVCNEFNECYRTAPDECMSQAISRFTVFKDRDNGTPVVGVMYACPVIPMS